LFLNFKPPPLRYFNYSRRAAGGIGNFKIFEPPPLYNLGISYLHR
jgi:hypothetical protein